MRTGAPRWGSECPAPGGGRAGPLSRRTRSADLLPQSFSGHPDLRFCADRRAALGPALDLEP